ncbi:MAG: efflux RND transporter periplasmic adaptor subunit, partial [Waterburya sp.]
PRAVKDNNVTSFRVKVALTTGQLKLQSGMNTRLTFISQPIVNAITIPLAAVVTQANGKTGVYVADAENKANFKVVKLGTASGDRIEILAGLTKGDQVFISPPPNITIEGVDTVNFE